LKECKLQIGEFCCSLRFTDSNYATSVRNYFDGFLSEEDHDLLIDVEVVMHDKWIDIPSSLILSKTVIGNKFDLSSGLLRGSLDLANNRAKIEIKKVIFRNARIFEHFLYQVYYTLLKKRYPDNKPNNFLVHASAVSRNGKGLVFTGPSGSGKTTIANLSSDYTVLNDEVVIIGKKNGLLQVTSTPFNAEFKNKKNISVPLKAIFFIRHGKVNCIKKLSAGGFTKDMFPEVIVPIPLLSTDKAHALGEMVDFCAWVAGEIPCYELHFIPNKSVWKCIDENLR